MADLSGLIDYGVLDGDVNTAAAQLCLDAAIRWFENAGVPEPADSDPLYDMGVYRLAIFYYYSRDPMGAVNFAAPPPFGIQGIVLQLKETGV